MAKPRKAIAKILLILLITSTPNIAIAERTEFIQQYNLYQKSVPAEDHFFDHEFSYQICIMPSSEFDAYWEKAQTTRDKYNFVNYLETPTDKHTRLLEINRSEIEQMIDIYTIVETFGQGDKDVCNLLKSEGFFGLEHKEE